MASSINSSLPHFCCDICYPSSHNYECRHPRLKPHTDGGGNCVLLRLPSILYAKPSRISLWQLLLARLSLASLTMSDHHLVRQQYPKWHGKSYNSTQPIMRYLHYNLPTPSPQEHQQAPTQYQATHLELESIYPYLSPRH